MSFDADEKRKVVDTTMRGIVDARAQVDKLFLLSVKWDAENERIKFTEDGQRAIAKLAEARTALDHAAVVVREALALALGVRPS